MCSPGRADKITCMHYCAIFPFVMLCYVLTAMINMHPVDTHKPSVLRYTITPVYDTTVTAVPPATQPVIGALVVGDIVSVRQHYCLNTVLHVACTIAQHN
jgi:hypothetical protein